MRQLLLVSLVSLLHACGGQAIAPEVTPTAQGSAPPASPGAPAPPMEGAVSAGSVPVSGDLASDTAFYRIRVAGTDEDARIERVERVVLPAGSLRPQRLGGALAVISYAGDEAKEIRFAALDTVVTSQVQVGDERVPVEHTGSGGASDVFVVADPTVTRIELRSVARVLSTVDAADLGAGPEAHGKPGLGGLYLQVSGAGRSVPGYPHIRVLGPLDLGDVPGPFRQGWRGVEGELLEGLREPTEAHLRFFQQAFDNVPERVVATVRAVAVAQLARDGESPMPAGACSRPGAGVVPRVTGGANGGTFVLNGFILDSDPDSLLSTVAHESAHVYQEALDKLAEAGSGWAFVFPEIDDFAFRRRITVSFERLWRHTHESALEVGLAEPWAGERVVGRNRRLCEDSAALPLGFPTVYGRSKLSEDVADFVSAILMDPAGSPVCR